VKVRGYFKGVQLGGSGERKLWYEYEGEYNPLGYCVVGKTKAAEERGLEENPDEEIGGPRPE
jgi:hypothetical protein